MEEKLWEEFEEFISETFTHIYSLSSSLLDWQPQISRWAKGGNIVVLFNHDPFLNALRRFRKGSETVLNRAKEKGLEIKGEKAEERIPKDPEQIAQMLLELLNKSIKASINASDLVFTAWSLWGLTRKYIEKAYPGKLELFQKLLDLEPIFVPDILPPEEQQNYTIFGYPDLSFYSTEIIRDFNRDYYYWPSLEWKSNLPFPGKKCWEGKCADCKSMSCLRTSSLGAALCVFNLTIWEIFKSPEEYKLSIFLEEVPNLYEEYRRRAEEELAKFPQPRLELELSYDFRQFRQFEIKGPLITKRFFYETPRDVRRVDNERLYIERSRKERFYCKGRILRTEINYVAGRMVEHSLAEIEEDLEL